MAIVDFIMSYYIVILIIVIIIIFALIGRYVDKIGYLRQAPVKKEKENKIDISNKRLQDIVGPQTKSQTTVSNETNIAEQIPAIETPKLDDVIFVTPKKEETTVSIDDIDSALFAPIEGNNEYDKLSKEVDALLPKKDVIDDDLLSDINNLSLDKTQKYNFGDIPDLDDVVLPNIKKNDEEEDIWKF